jgi:hypothetical protein
MRISIPSRFFLCAMTVLAETTRQPLALLFLALLLRAPPPPVLYGIIYAPTARYELPAPLLESSIDRAVKRLPTSICDGELFVVSAPVYTF